MVDVLLLLLWGLLVPLYLFAVLGSNILGKKYSAIIRWVCWVVGVILLVLMACMLMAIEAAKVARLGGKGAKVMATDRKYDINLWFFILVAAPFFLFVLGANILPDFWGRCKGWMTEDGLSFDRGTDCDHATFWNEYEDTHFIKQNTDMSSATLWKLLLCLSIGYLLFIIYDAVFDDPGWASGMRCFFGSFLALFFMFSPYSGGAIEMGETILGDYEQRHKIKNGWAWFAANFLSIVYPIFVFIFGLYIFLIRSASIKPAQKISGGSGDRG